MAMTDKKALVELLSKKDGCCLDNPDDVLALADYLIANGAEIVVRCEKCIHNESSICQNNNVNVCWYWGRATTGDGYCDRGVERPSDET